MTGAVIVLALTVIVRRLLRRRADADVDPTVMKQLRQRYGGR